MQGLPAALPPTDRLGPCTPKPPAEEPMALLETGVGGTAACPPAPPSGLQRPPPEGQAFDSWQGRRQLPAPSRAGGPSGPRLGVQAQARAARRGGAAVGASGELPQAAQRLGGLRAHQGGWVLEQQLERWGAGGRCHGLPEPGAPANTPPPSLSSRCAHPLPVHRAWGAGTPWCTPPPALCGGHPPTALLRQASAGSAWEPTER